MRKKLTDTALSAIEVRVNNITDKNSQTVYGIVSPQDGKLLRSIKCANGEWIETDDSPEIYTAEKLERAVKSQKRFVIVIGGRGSMKSVGVVDIMLGGIRDYGDKVYFLREYQESIAESVHALNKEEIKRLGLEGFTIQENAIYHEGGGEAKYRGLSRNPESVKSAAGFRRFMVEEAATLSTASITNLTPTARNKAKFGLPDELVKDEDDNLDGVQIWFVANPRSSEDPFSKRFIVPFLSDLNKYGYYEDDLHLIVKMNYTDNPWFKLSGLEQERIFDYENKPRAVYDHIWEGAFLDDIDNAIIQAEWFDACIDAHIKLGFEPLGQEKMSYDPADSGDAKAIAYQQGSVILDVRSTSHGLIDTATDWALSHVRNIKPDVFLFDADGIGGGLKRQISDSLHGKKITVVPFHGSGGVDNPDEIYDALEGDREFDGSKTNKEVCSNKRAFCYMVLMDRMKKTYLAVTKGKYYSPDELISFSSNIAELTQLRAELCRIPRIYVSSGRFQIMNKKDMKKIGIPSPNMADAVMMLQRTVSVFDDEDDYYEDSQTTEGRWL